MQSFDRADQEDPGNENSTISEFPLTGRAARSIPHPLGWGGRTQFDFCTSRYRNAETHSSQLILLMLAAYRHAVKLFHYILAR